MIRPRPGSWDWIARAIASVALASAESDATRAFRSTSHLSRSSTPATAARSAFQSIEREKRRRPKRPSRRFSSTVRSGNSPSDWCTTATPWRVRSWVQRHAQNFTVDLRHATWIRRVVARQDLGEGRIPPSRSVRYETVQLTRLHIEADTVERAVPAVCLADLLQRKTWLFCTQREGSLLHAPELL